MRVLFRENSDGEDSMPDSVVVSSSSIRFVASKCKPAFSGPNINELVGEMLEEASTGLKEIVMLGEMIGL